MTVPSTTINMITHIRNGFMQDTSGNASLNSNKYRDGAMKGSGDVAMTDFAERAWAQGRTIKRTQDGDSTATVRPYCWDQRRDNLGPDDATFTFNTVDGLPRWRFRHDSAYAVPAASYSNSYFYCPTATQLEIKGSTESHNTGSTRCDFSVIGFADGYLSGGSLAHLEDVLSVDLARGKTFTTDSRFPYILVSFRGYTYSGSGTVADYAVKNVEVRKV